MYVALSRCKSFEGIVLRSKIAHSSVKTDSIVKSYSEEADKNAPDEAHLARSKAEYQQSLLLELFDFSRLRRNFNQVFRVFMEHENALHGEARQQLQALEAHAGEQVITIAERFKPQIQQYFAQSGLPEENALLLERLQKARGYFVEKLDKELLPAAKSIQILTDNKSVKKVALEALDALLKEIFTKNACFATLNDGFSAGRYLRAKADAELDFRPAKTAAEPSFSDQARAPKNTPHPALFLSLKRWREEVAETSNMILYEVMPTRSLLEIVQFLPLDLPTLKKIKGIGAARSQRFGAELIAIIQQYCQENHVQTNHMSGLVAEALALKAPKIDTKTQSFDLYKAGKNLDEIAAERGFATSTIEGHLSHFIGLGELDIFTVMEREQVEEIEGYFRENNTASSAEAKAHFKDKYSYGQIKMVLVYLSAGEAEEAN